MPVQKESKLSQWIAALREGWPAARAGFDEWKDAVRAEPVLLWATPAIRYTVYGAGALIAISVLMWVVGAIRPPDAAPPAETGYFHVLCTSPGCGHHFLINKEFDFDDFPVACPKCGKRTGQQATRCASDICRGRWVVPRARDNQYHCPHCGGYLGDAG